MPNLLDPSRLPARYSDEWGADFWARIDQSLHPNVRILDVGAGRRPTIDPQRRPDGCHYVGLDVSRSELELAPTGSYDQIVAADAHERLPELTSSFDLIVMWQVLEHFRDLPAAAEIMRTYVRAGGQLVAHLSGRNALYALANRALPDRLGNAAAARLMRREPETVFPAHYDRCTATGVRQAFAQWSSVEVIPFWRGADYFQRLPMLLPLYLRYENWAAQARREDLATHYTVVARR